MFRSFGDRARLDRRRRCPRRTPGSMCSCGDSTEVCPTPVFGPPENECVGYAGHGGPQVRCGTVTRPDLLQADSVSAVDGHAHQGGGDVESGGVDEHVDLVPAAVCGVHGVCCEFCDGGSAEDGGGSAQDGVGYLGVQVAQGPCLEGGAATLRSDQGGEKCFVAPVFDGPACTVGQRHSGARAHAARCAVRAGDTGVRPCGADEANAGTSWRGIGRRCRRRRARLRHGRTTGLMRCSAA